MCIVRWRRNDDYVNVKNRFSIIKKRVADGNPFPTGDTPILIKRTLFDCKGNDFLSDMQMFDCIIDFILEELTSSLTLLRCIALPVIPIMLTLRRIFAERNWRDVDISSSGRLKRRLKIGLMIMEDNI